MPFREKSAWITLVVDLGVYAFYFATLLQALRAGEANGERVIGLFVGCVVVLILAHIILGIVIAALAPKDSEAPADERDRAIDGRAAQFGFIALNVLVLTVAGAGPLAAGVSPYIQGMTPQEISTLLMSNGILLGVVVADLFANAVRIVSYRLGR